jgi:hypothetical protein
VCAWSSLTSAVSRVSGPCAASRCNTCRASGVLTYSRTAGFGARNATGGSRYPSAVAIA